MQLQATNIHRIKNVKPNNLIKEGSNLNNPTVREDLTTAAVDTAMQTKAVDLLTHPATLTPQAKPCPTMDPKHKHTIQTPTSSRVKHPQQIKNVEDPIQEKGMDLGPGPDPSDPTLAYLRTNATVVEKQLTTLDTHAQHFSRPVTTAGRQDTSRRSANNLSFSNKLKASNLNHIRLLNYKLEFSLLYKLAHHNQKPKVSLVPFPALARIARLSPPTIYLSESSIVRLQTPQEAKSTPLTTSALQRKIKQSTNQRKLQVDMSRSPHYLKISAPSMTQQEETVSSEIEQDK